MQHNVFIASVYNTFTPPAWRSFSFALHPDPVQGFYFAPLQYSPIQAFTACFAASMQLYRPRHKTAHMALQRLFLRLHPLNRPRYQTDTSDYNAACDTLESIHAPGRAQPVPDATATPGRCTGQHRPPIIIMYIRRCRGVPCCGSMPDSAAYSRPCKPGGVSALPGIETGTGSARRVPGIMFFLERRAARNHWRLPPHLFSGFRPIANRGQQ